MVSLVLNLLFYSLPLLVCGVVALLRAAGSPSGRGLVFAGGGLLVLAALVTGGWEVWTWSRFSGPHSSFSWRMAMPPPLLPSTTMAYGAGRALLLTAALALLLFGVLSARRHQRAAPAADPGHQQPTGPGHPSRPGRPHDGFRPQAPAPGRPPASPPGSGPPRGQGPRIDG
ncbi:MULTISPECIES: hypothetical protein [Nocardiopsis]|uniref:Uncharacterized protein n=1 Tax=Nocardiopsis sinuspersici TaxID=501010 RepID=A0A1V3C4Y1_9ACTN|nr:MULTISPECIES: hypothetical protein [Nocardiopsis]OOC55841.1 hypothetical protein NOSIN_20065 [Nocardiopsis sinuspersici]